MPFQRTSSVFLFSFAPPPPGQGWGSLGPHGQTQPYAPSKFHRTVSSRPATCASICMGGHIPDTCSTHTRHMLNTCLASRRCVGDAWRCGERLRLRFIARIKAQHGSRRNTANPSLKITTVAIIRKRCNTVAIIRNGNVYDRDRNQHMRDTCVTHA